MPKELAQLAWDAYSEAVGGKSWNNDPLPPWDEMVADERKQRIVAAWRKAAEAVRQAVE